ncbi:MAG: 4-alpha-glucanotransferase [Rhodospirillales bacterium]|nr:4-alpha-glucanotransferase [Rhodospirillales bacterium]
MDDDTLLSRLAERAGIESAYWDVYGGHHKTSDDTRRKFLSAMGYSIDDDDAILASLNEIEERPWRRMLEPVTVLRTTGGAPDCVLDPKILVVLPEEQADGELGWSIDLEDGQRLDGRMDICDLSVVEKRSINNVPRIRLATPLPENLSQGYHRISMRHGQSVQEGALIIAPPSAYRPGWLSDSHKKVWGIACQLYALRSPSNWGMGDFSDLSALCEKTAHHGGGVVGLPPLHSLFPTRPEHVSPYSPSSRLSINPLYIDVTAIPDYAECPEAQRIVGDADFAARIEAARQTNVIAFAEVSALKRQICDVLFTHFEKANPPGGSSPRRMDYERFATEDRDRKNRLALFSALQEHFAPLSVEQWPAAYRDPGSTEAADFAIKHERHVRFHLYLQWEAERQLAAAANTCVRAGMAIGLYRDLAVGVAPDGADAWTTPEAFVTDVRFGAPPDPLGPVGQNWGMPPFDPNQLYEKAYGPYVDMLRANMRHAGAVRIDHVMWLQHMFWIPLGGDGRDGAYVRYPLDDLLAILALESRRNRCLVVGEALGTVPEGFRERLAAEGILSYCLMQFERHPDGLYKRPDTYPVLALATPASHDLPTLAGFWREADIQIHREIGLITSDGDAADRRAARAHERDLLIASLVDQRLLPPDFPNAADIGDGEMKTLIAAVHSFLARSPAAMMVVNLEDILSSTTQVNMPGTIDEYPNWRQKLPVDLDRILDAKSFAAAAGRIRAERERATA